MTVSFRFTRLKGVQARRLLCAASVVAALSGCSSSEVLPPSPLPDFDAQIQINELWDYDIGDGVDGKYIGLSPSVTEEFVYVAAADGDVSKLDRLKGKPLWEVETDESISGGVAAGYGVVAFGTTDGFAVTLAEDTGEPKWRTRLTAQIFSVPAIGPELIIYQTYDGKLHALAQDTGKVEWVYDTNIPALTLRGTSSPLQRDAVVLAGFANGKMVALDTQAGYVGWERVLSQPKGRSELEKLSDIDGRFWVDGERIYVANFQGNLSALDLRTGQPFWVKDYSSYVGVAEHNERVFAVNDESVVNAFNAENGGELWEQVLLKGRRGSTPAAYDDYVVIGDYEGYLHWIHAETGAFAARVKLDSASINSIPVVRDDTLYVQSSGGEIAAYKIVKPNESTQKGDTE